MPFFFDAVMCYQSAPKIKLITFKKLAGKCKDYYSVYTRDLKCKFDLSLANQMILYSKDHEVFSFKQKHIDQKPAAKCIHGTLAVITY